MQASLEHRPHCAVLRVSGDFRIWDHERDEQEILKFFPDDVVLPGNRLVLSLADVTHIDSLGITVLVKVVILCTKNHVDICTVLPRGTAGVAVRSTRIFAAWPDYASEDEAITRCAQQAAS